MPAIKYTFSGHESFTCKTLWLKKGYDFILNGFDFNSPDAVIRLGVGKNIVQGVWEGIKSAAAWIRDKVTNFFGGIVDGVKDFLGIHSPSKVFAGIGGFMAEGLGVGFDDEFSGIKKNIENRMNFDAGTISGRYEMSAYSSPVATSEQNRVFSLLEKYLPMLANMKIVLDGGTVVGILAPEIDSALGKINAREARAV